MDYWKEAEKIYTDLERKGYRMEFFSDNGEHYYSNIDFIEKGASPDKTVLSLYFHFPIEQLLQYTDEPWGLEDNFICSEFIVFDKIKGKQLQEYFIKEFNYSCSKLDRILDRIYRCENPLKMFYFYVTVAEKYYSSVISKVKNSIGKEG